MAKTAKNAQEKLTLSVEVRTEFGKKSRQLRKKGFIPANVYGPGFESKSIKIEQLTFHNIYKQAHETGLVYVEFDKESIPTLITNLQKHPITGSVLHVDFRKVNMKQKIETAVPVVFIGESDAVKTYNGVLITQADHLYVDALPANIPQQIEIDISKLTEIGSSISIADLPKGEGYDFTEEPEKVIVSVTAHKEESTTPETDSDLPEVEGGADAEGATSEGEASSTEGGSEEKSE